MMLAYHILIPVLSAMAMNGIIYKNKSYTLKSSLLPPGYIIGIVWIIIFAFLGYVHYLLYSLHNQTNYGSASVVLFILYSLAYPLINTMHAKYGYFLNLISLILSFILGLIVITYSKHIFLFMIPLLVWVSFVNLVILYSLLDS